MWSLICFFLSVAFFVVGRWSIFPESNQQTQPVSGSDGRQLATQSQSAQNLEGSRNAQRNSTENVISDTELNRKSGLQQSQEQETFESSKTPLPDTLPFPEINEATSEPNAFPVPQQSPEMVTIQEKENEILKEEMVDSLRNSGMSDDEIEQQIESLSPPPSEIEEMDPPQSADISLEQLKEEFTSSLRETGMPEEEIDQMMEGFISSVNADTPPDQ